MIHLDTNALIWLLAGHPRAKRLGSLRTALVVSPAVFLEVGVLVELGKVRLAGTLSEARRDSRFRVDHPDGAAWFEEAEGLAFTRDPFDRLIVANALLRSAKLATSDAKIIAFLGPDGVVEL